MTFTLFSPASYPSWTLLAHGSARVPSRAGHSLAAGSPWAAWIPPCSLSGPTGLILGKLLPVFMEHSGLGPSVALVVNPLTLLTAPCVSALWGCAFLENKQGRGLPVVSGAVETTLPWIVFVIFWVAALLRIGTQVLALCHSGCIWACRLCFRAWRSERRGSWDVCGPQESRSLALHSMLMLTSSTHCALWTALTLRRMESRVRGWWRPLFFIRSLVAFSLSITDCLAGSRRSLATKENCHLQQGLHFKTHLHYFLNTPECAHLVLDI